MTEVNATSPVLAFSRCSPATNARRESKRLDPSETAGRSPLSRRRRGGDNRAEGLNVKVLPNGDIEASPYRKEEGFNAS